MNLKYLVPLISVILILNWADAFKLTNAYQQLGNTLKKESRILPNSGGIGGNFPISDKLECKQRKDKLEILVSCHEKKDGSNICSPFKNCVEEGLNLFPAERESKPLPAASKLANQAVKDGKDSYGKDYQNGNDKSVLQSFPSSMDLASNAFQLSKRIKEKRNRLKIPLDLDRVLELGNGMPVEAKISKGSEVYRFKLNMITFRRLFGKEKAFINKGGQGEVKKVYFRDELVAEKAFFTDSSKSIYSGKDYGSSNLKDLDEEGDTKDSGKESGSNDLIDKNGLNDSDQFESSVITDSSSDESNSEDSYSSAYKEIYLTTHLNHPNLIKAKGGGIDLINNKIVMWMPLMDFSLREVSLDESRKYSVIQKVGMAILSGLIYLESKQIIHVDLKPDNILLKGNPSNLDQIPVNDIKISDLGLCVTYHSKIMPRPGGTIAYWAPELKNKDLHYNYGIDVWSFGVILMEMISGKIFRNYNQFEQEINERYFVDEDLMRLIESALEEDKSLRKSAAQLMEEDFFFKKTFDHDPQVTLKNLNIFNKRKMKN